jgi:hypothetical protein
MKALKSKLAQEMLESGVKIPLQNGAKVEHKGKEYTVKIVPKASNKPKR